MKLLLFFFRCCGGMRLYAHVMPVFSIDAPAVSGVVLELCPSVWDRDACIKVFYVNKYFNNIKQCK